MLRLHPEVRNAAGKHPVTAKAAMEELARNAVLHLMAPILVTLPQLVRKLRPRVSRQRISRILPIPIQAISMLSVNTNGLVMELIHQLVLTMQDIQVFLYQVPSAIRQGTRSPDNPRWEFPGKNHIPILRAADINNAKAHQSDLAWNRYFRHATQMKVSLHGLMVLNAVSISFSTPHFLDLTMPHLGTLSARRMQPLARPSMLIQSRNGNGS